MKIRARSVKRAPVTQINMLFAGWEVRIVKNCDRGLENGQGRGHSFSLYGPTLSR